MTDSAHDDGFVAFRGRWAMEIGRFVMAFGSIEGMTYALVRSNFDAPVADVLLKNMDLGKRLEVLIALAQGKGGGWIAIANVLKEVDKLAKKRNLIAHNGVTIDVFLSPENHLSVTETIRSHRHRRDTRTRTPPEYLVPFEQLVKHREEAEALDSQLLDVVRAVTEDE